MTTTLHCGDCRQILAILPVKSIHCCVTSPPYFGLRDYGVAGQIGLEATPDAYVAELVAVFREVRRVLRDDGTLWLNLGDTYSRDPKKGDRGEYLGIHKNIIDSGCHTASQGRQLAGLKPKDLIGIPWRVAFALQADGWYLRQDIIWSKPNPMPESVTDRCTKAHEYIFLMSKSARYYYDAAAIAEDVTQSTIERLSQPNIKNQIGSDRVPGKTNGNMKAVFRPSGDYGNGAGRNDGDNHPSGGWQSVTRNKRSVWEVASQPFAEAHFATFPPNLIEPCVLAGCPKGGTVLDPFGGAGTTGLVADRLGRNALLIELNPEYSEIANQRIRGDAGMFADMVTPT